MSDEKPKRTPFRTFWGDDHRWPDDGPEFWDAYYRDIGHPNSDWDDPWWVEYRRQNAERLRANKWEDRLSDAWFLFVLGLWLEMMGWWLFGWSPTMALLDLLFGPRTP